MKGIVIALLLSCSSAWAADVLTNADVMKLVRAGISADVILVKIEQSDARFDTSTGALVDLKTAGTPDAVIKAMLLKQPTTPAVQAQPQPQQEQRTPQPAPAAVVAESQEHCISVSYYTNGANGWSWYPASACTDASSISIDEQRIPASDVVAQCISKSIRFGTSAATDELWIATANDTHKLQAAPDVVQKLSAELSHAAASAPHGDCSNRAIRRFFPRQ